MKNLKTIIAIGIFLIGTNWIFAQQESQLAPSSLPPQIIQQNSNSSTPPPPPSSSNAAPIPGIVLAAAAAAAYGLRKRSAIPSH